MLPDVPCVYGVFYKGVCLYIGQTVCFNTRVGSHKRLLRNGDHHCDVFQKWFSENFVNIDDLRFYVLEIVPGIEDRAFKEFVWFNHCNPLFWGKKPNPENIWEISVEAKEKLNTIREQKSIERFTKILDEYGERIVKLYRDDLLSMENVSEELELSYATVRKVLLHKGVAIRSHRDNLGNEFVRFKSDVLLKKELSKVLKECDSITSAAHHIGMSVNAFRDLIINLNLYTPGRVYSYRDFIADYGEEFLTDFFLDEYIFGWMSLNDLAERFGVGRKVILTTIKKLDVESLSNESPRDRMRRKLSARNQA